MKAFHIIEGNTYRIGENPPVPAFYFLAGHQPHAGKCRGGSQRIGPGYGAFPEIGFQARDSQPGSRENQREIKELNADKLAARELNMQDLFLSLIALCPHKPAVEAHNGIIEVNRGFARKVIAKTQVHIEAGINKPYGIGIDTFLAAEPNTGQPRNDGDNFKNGIQG